MNIKTCNYQKFYTKIKQLNRLKSFLDVMIGALKVKVIRKVQSSLIDQQQEIFARRIVHEFPCTWHDIIL